MYVGRLSNYGVSAFQYRALSVWPEPLTSSLNNGIDKHLTQRAEFTPPGNSASFRVPDVCDTHGTFVARQGEGRWLFISDRSATNNPTYFLLVVERALALNDQSVDSSTLPRSLSLGKR